MQAYETDAVCNYGSDFNNDSSYKKPRKCNCPQLILLLSKKHLCFSYCGVKQTRVLKQLAQKFSGWHIQNQYLFILNLMRLVKGESSELCNLSCFI